MALMLKKKGSLSGVLESRLRQTSHSSKQFLKLGDKRITL